MKKILTKVLFFGTIFLVLISFVMVFFTNQYFVTKNNSIFITDYSSEAIEASEEVSTVVLEKQNEFRSSDNWDENLYPKITYQNNENIYVQAKVEQRHLAVKYYNNGTTTYKIDWEDLIVSYGSYPKIDWISDDVFIVNLDTIVFGNYPFTTNFLCSFEQEPLIYHLDDTMYNYEVEYVPSSDASSVIYFRGWGDRIYQDLWKASRTGNKNDIVEWQFPVSTFNNIKISNYNDIDNVLAIEDNGIYDLRDSSNPLHYSSPEEFEEGIKGEEISEDNIYDYMEEFGINNLKDSILNYAKTVYKTTYYVLKKDWKGLLELAFPDLYEFFEGLVEDANNIIDNIDNINNILDVIDGIISDDYKEEIRNSYEVVKSRINELEAIFKGIDSIVDFSDNLKSITSNDYLTFIVSLNANLNSGDSVMSLQDSQGDLLEMSMEKFFLNKVPSYYWKLINQYDENFELSTEYNDETIYFYTNIDQTEYLAFDLKHNEMFIERN